MFESSVSTDPAVGRNLRGHLRADRKYADILKLTTPPEGAVKARVLSHASR
jgi:hypothetical protein